MGSTALETCRLLLAAAGDVQAVQEYLDGNPHQLENRTVFQSNLLHIAARNGHPALVRELLQRGIDMNALDFVSTAHAHQPVSQG